MYLIKLRFVMNVMIFIKNYYLPMYNLKWMHSYVG